MGVGIWLALGLGAALGDSGADVLTKRYFVQLSPYGMARGAVPGRCRFWLWWPWASSAAADAAFLADNRGGDLPLEVLGAVQMPALRLCHLSLCVPFLAFTPIFK